MKYLPDGNAMTNEEKVNQVQETAFITSHYICKNYHDAQDIAQDVCLQYLLKKDDLENPIRNPISWSKIVARNATYKKLKEQRKLSDNGNLDNLSDPNQSDPTGEAQLNVLEDMPNLEEKDVKKLLNRDDFTTYTKYIKYKGKTGAYADACKLTYSSAASKVYRMKRNLKAAYLTEAGYVGGKDIVDYQTNKNIIKFVKTFADKMKQNDLKSLHKYFEKYSIDNIPNLEIEEYKIYEIKSIAERKYEMLYGYLDMSKRISFVIMIFSLNRFNKINILNIMFPQRVIKVKANLKEVNSVLPKSSMGATPIKGIEALKAVTDFIERE